MGTRDMEQLLQSELVLPDQSSPDMRFASRLISEMQRELSHRKRYMLRIVSKWLIAFDYVKMLEEEHMLVTDPIKSHTQFFLGTLSVVHGLGTLLLAQIQSDEADRLMPMFNLTFADLTASVEELGDIRRSLESDITPEMVSAMNRDLFGSAKPS